MKSYVLINKPDQRSKNISDKIKKKLDNLNFIYNEENPDLCIVVGGDGTFLHAVGVYQNHLETTAFIGIHTGTLGFFSSYCEDEIDLFYDDIVNKKQQIKEVDVLEIEHLNSQQKMIAINEMRIENSYRTQIMDIYINNNKMERYHGTGICISTQLGSTAYNRSIQGSIIYEGLSVMQITEIAGIHHSKYRSLGSSLVIPSNVEIKITSDDFNGALLCSDANCIKLHDKDEIRCRLKNVKLKLAQYRERNYLTRLKGLYE
ncbi:MAG: NAD(+)/NADH kinase [Anaerorhabdus sp.]